MVGLLSLVGRLWRGNGVLYVVTALAAPFVPFTLGMGGSCLTCMDLRSGSLIPLMC